VLLFSIAGDTNSMEDIMEKKKFLILLTHATDDQERANIGLAFAAGMVAEDMDVALVFMFEGVNLMIKGGIDSIAAPNVTPGKDLLEIIMNGGAKLLVCTPCILKRGIQEADLIQGCTLISAASVIPEMASRKVITF